EKFLCNVFPDRMFLTLGAIEQMDDGEFFANPEYSVKKFLAHIARNDKEAFSYSVSNDGARGLMQFMNSKRNATYNLVLRKYREVNLVTDHEKGMADMKNSIKAAICLADMNIAQMPQRAKDKFKDDWFLGGIFVAAAHNGGIGRTLLLWKESERKQAGLGFYTYIQKRVLLKETENFIKKYFETWKMLESR
ncbi:MAG: transglycosylase SLT domain-containing protein, partial [Patescibacteria group bacterium]